MTGAPGPGTSLMDFEKGLKAISADVFSAIKACRYWSVRRIEYRHDPRVNTVGMMFCVSRCLHDTLYDRRFRDVLERSVDLLVRTYEPEQWWKRPVFYVHVARQTPKDGGCWETSRMWVDRRLCWHGRVFECDVELTDLEMFLTTGTRIGTFEDDLPWSCASGPCDSEERSLHESFSRMHMAALDEYRRACTRFVCDKAGCRKPCCDFEKKITS